MQLSKLKYRDLLFLASSTDLENIVFRNEKAELKSSYDVALVLGGPKMIPDRINKALEYYQKGIAKKILVSGSFGFLSISIPSEASKMCHYLLNHGVLKEDILVEKKSHNTWENMKFSLELLKSKYDLNEISLALITSDYHLKRSLATLTHLCPLKDITGIGIKDTLVNIDTWKKSSFSKFLILKEALLLLYYVKKKCIEDITIPNVLLNRRKSKNNAS